MSKRLLCCTAHPDDECFAFGGALALAARAGYQVHVTCFTEGTAGSYRGGATDSAELGRMRREEIARSCRVLGVDSWEVLDYQDGKLEFAEFHSAAGLIVERIRRMQPEIVLTFGTDGALNVHNDHTMVSCFASSAFHWAARARRYPEQGLAPFAAEKLYHLSAAFTLPGREPLLPSPWSVKLDITTVKDIKEAAFQEHTTQLPVYDKVKPFWDEYGGWEYYTLAGVREPREMKLTTGMFGSES